MHSQYNYFEHVATNQNLSLIKSYQVSLTHCIVVLARIYLLSGIIGKLTD